jgi:hypothetical protein
MVMFMLETMAMSTSAPAKAPGRKMWMDPGKTSNLQGLKGQPILYVPEPRLLIAQEYSPLTEQGLKEWDETLVQCVLNHSVNPADQQGVGVRMINSTVNDARVRQEITGLEITNSPAAAVLPLAGEAGAGHDEGKRKKEW